MRVVLLKLVANTANGISQKMVASLVLRFNSLIVAALLLSLIIVSIPSGATIVVISSVVFMIVAIFIPQEADERLARKTTPRGIVWQC